MSGFEVEPQSTSIAPSKPAGSPTGDNNNNSGSSTPPPNATNPSLILAFLALSFFTMAMIFIFGFRRYQYFHGRVHDVFGRGGAATAADPNRPSEQQAAAGDLIRLRRLPGTRPKMWDVCTDSGVRWWEVKTRGGAVAGRKGAGGGGGGAEDSRKLWNWDDVMPLSASRVANADKSGTPSFRSSSGRNNNHNPVSSSIFQRFCQWPRLGATSDKRSLGRTRSLTALLPESRLRLAVLVAMPSERYPIYYSDKGGLRGHERGTFGYELGLYEVPWDDDADDT